MGLKELFKRSETDESEEEEETWDMEPEKVRELSGPDFGTVCAECCHQAICDWSQ